MRLSLGRLKEKQKKICRDYTVGMNFLFCLFVFVWNSKTGAYLLACKKGVLTTCWPEDISPNLTKWSNIIILFSKGFLIGPRTFQQWAHWVCPVGSAQNTLNTDTVKATKEAIHRMNPCRFSYKSDRLLPFFTFVQTWSISIITIIIIDYH